MTTEQKNIIENAAESRYPYADDSYFNACQNSRRGDFCDGALWYIENISNSAAAMYNVLVQVWEKFEPEDDEEANLFADIKFILEAAAKSPAVKRFDKPTYPINVSEV
jgi:tetrahydromethanopterin S-methyltransferase subunit A